MSEVFVARAPLRFGECDPAGIAFYPRLVERINAAVEDWFAGPIDLSFHDMHLKRRAGIPCKTMEIDFRAPARLGEDLAVALTVEALGRASFDLKAEATVGDRVVFVARQRLVWAQFDGEGVKAAPIPPELRARMAAFLAAP